MRCAPDRSRRRAESTRGCRGGRLRRGVGKRVRAKRRDLRQRGATARAPQERALGSKSSVATGLLRSLFGRARSGRGMDRILDGWSVNGDRAWRWVRTFRAADPTACPSPLRNDPWTHRICARPRVAGERWPVWLAMRRSSRPRWHRFPVARPFRSTAHDSLRRRVPDQRGLRLRRLHQSRIPCSVIDHGSCASWPSPCPHRSARRSPGAMR